VSTLKPSTARRYAERRVSKTKATPIEKRKSKPGRGAAKGAAFERQIAKLFSLWISDGESPDLLWRSAGSGGRSTLRRKQTGRGIEYHASDIAPLHPDAAPFVDVFTLECKTYASIDLHQLFYDPEHSTIAKWWAQACRDAASVGRWPLMVVKELRQPALVVLLASAAPRSLQMFRNRVHLRGLDVVLMTLSDLLAMKYKMFSHDYKSELKHRVKVPGAADDRPTPHRPRKRLL
jgi:hypothetical protein